MDYEDHLKEKQLIRQLKEQEKEFFYLNHRVVACFDLEKVLNVRCEVKWVYFIINENIPIFFKYTHFIINENIQYTIS